MWCNYYLPYGVALLSNQMDILTTCTVIMSFKDKGLGGRYFLFLKRKREENGIVKMYSDVSITARAFSESMGFCVEKEQVFQIGDEKLKNYRMVRRCV